MCQGEHTGHVLKGGGAKLGETQNLTRRVDAAIVLRVGAGVSEANVVAELVPYNALIAVEVPGGRSTDVAEPGPTTKVTAVARDVDPGVIIVRRIVAHRTRRSPALKPQFQHSPPPKPHGSARPINCTSAHHTPRHESNRVGGSSSERAREMEAKMLSKPLYPRLPIIVVTARVAGEGDAELNGDHVRVRVRRPLVLRVPDLVVCGVRVHVAAVSCGAR